MELSSNRGKYIELSKLFLHFLKFKTIIKLSINIKKLMLLKNAND